MLGDCLQHTELPGGLPIHQLDRLEPLRPLLRRPADQAHGSTTTFWVVRRSRKIKRRSSEDGVPCGTLEQSQVGYYYSLRQDV